MYIRGLGRLGLQLFALILIGNLIPLMMYFISRILLYVTAQPCPYIIIFNIDSLAYGRR